MTQFTEIGWKYLLNGTGSGELPNGGYYATWVDPKSTDFTMNIVKISRAWSCNEGEGILKLALFQWSSQILGILCLKRNIFARVFKKDSRRKRRLLSDTLSASFEVTMRCARGPHFPTFKRKRTFWALQEISVQATRALNPLSLRKIYKKSSFFT